MTRAARRGVRGRRLGRAVRAGRAVVDATCEPVHASIPEAVFDRVTGPYVHRAAPAGPGAPRCDEDA